MSVKHQGIVNIGRVHKKETGSDCEGDFCQWLARECFSNPQSSYPGDRYYRCEQPDNHFYIIDGS